MLFPSSSSLSSKFSIPTSGFSMSTIDDAASKAKSVASDAKDKAVSAANTVEGKIVGEKKKLKLYSPEYYAACTFGGILACGTTHALVTPLDLVKCRKQVDKNLYKSNFDGWSKIWKTEGGLKGLYTGVGPTLVGYSIQGACKYGFYEFFKKTYSDMAGPENAAKYKDFIYVAGSASAEFIADIGLVPMEAVKVRMQTTIPPFATGLVDATRKFHALEGTSGFYKSLTSLWSRQIPYTVMKFWSFEATVTAIYNRLGKPKESYNKLQQLGVSFVGGYIAGVFCAIVSHPADVMVSKLNAKTTDGSKPTVGGIYKQIGFPGLWTGLTTRIVMIGTLTALQWLIYDYVKQAFGFPTTGGGAPVVEKK